MFFGVEDISFSCAGALNSFQKKEPRRISNPSRTRAFFLGWGGGQFIYFVIRSVCSSRFVYLSVLAQEEQKDKCIFRAIVRLEGSGIASLRRAFPKGGFPIGEIGLMIAKLVSTEGNIKS